MKISPSMSRVLLKCIVYISFIALIACSTEKVNRFVSLDKVPTKHILKFKTIEAREAYLRQLPLSATVETLDDLFIGAIITHSNEEKCLEEENKINQIKANSLKSASTDDLIIEKFERDGYITISKELSRSTAFLSESISNENDENFESIHPMNTKKKQDHAPWHLDRVGRTSLPLKGDFEYIDNENCRNIDVYIVDTGIQKTHKEFEGRAKSAYTADSSFPSGEDCHGHGTHVAALVGGKISGSFKRATLHDVRVMDCFGSGSNSDLIKALEWITKNAKKTSIINLSLGGDPSDLVDEAIRSLWKKGLFPVIAAGNEGVDACTRSPARVSEGLTVGASTKKDSRAPFSNYGGCVQVYAPGEDITSAGHLDDESFAIMSGTSMATPIVSGIAASILSLVGNITAGELKTKVLELAVQGVTQTIKPLANIPTTNICPQNYGGIECNVAFCGMKLANEQDVCSGHGTCQGPNQCACESGYSGSNCESYQCFSIPSSNEVEVCSGHGQCQATDQCKCTNGWSGSQCEIEPIPTCFGLIRDDKNVCSGKGVCIAQDLCQCQEGYFGSQCNHYTCFGKLNSDATVCGGKGQCVAPNQCTSN